MATITDATVVSSAYDTSGNGGRKLVRLNNGWLVAGAINAGVLYWFVSKDNGNTWTQLCYTNSSVVSSFAMVANGVNVIAYATYMTSASTYRFDATTVTNTALFTSDNFETGQTNVAGASLAINDAGTELNAAWASKNSNYPNSFNIRYAKGTINADSSVTWGTVQQLTTYNTSGNYIQNPTVVCRGSIAHIIYEWKNGSNFGISHLSSTDNFIAASLPQASSVYGHSNPTAIYVPQSINGLANGRIWVAWQGYSASNQTYNGIFITYSDDGGSTWNATPKTYTNASFHLRYPSLTASKSGEVNVLYSNSSGFLNRAVYSAGAWGAQTSVKSLSGATDCYPAALYDPTISFTSPLVIYKDTAKIGFYGTWTVITISVTPGFLGTKSDRTTFLSYSITTDGSMSLIIEKVNGVSIGGKSVNSGEIINTVMTSAQWDAIKYGKYADAAGGKNTFTVEMGTETWTYTFDKRLATDADILSAVKAVQDSQNAYLPSIKKQLVDKVGGVTSDSFENIIKNGSYGKKWAKGTTTSGTTVENIITVTGLAFRPRYIMWENQPNGVYVGFYNADMSAVNYPTDVYVVSASSYDIFDKSRVTITDSSFSLPTGYGASGTAVNFNWWAFE